MFFQFLSYCFYIFLLLLAPSIEAKTIKIDSHATPLTVVIMVKNEADVICQTLQPFVDGGVDSFLVYDTGSTDNTPEIVKQFFSDNNIVHGYIVEETFVDFSISRNRALDIAKEIFPYTDFLIMPDAEWYIENTKELIEFCKKNKNYIPKNALGGCYLIRIISSTIDFYQPRLIRHLSNVRFIGAVHEVLNEQATDFIPDNIFFIFNPNDKGNKKSKNRWERDLELLLQSHKEEPKNERTVFYLGQTYQFLNDWEHAAEFYLKRTQMTGWHEENYMAFYRLANVIDYLAEQKKDNNQYTWEQALHYYLKAYALSPHRAEPLVCIAKHYIDIDQKEIAYLFAYQAAQLPYPKNDVLFVEKNIYDFIRYDFLGQCAFAVNEYKIGKKAILQALKKHQNLPHLFHNLKLYLQYTN